MSPEASLQHILQRPPGHCRVLGTPASGKTSTLVARYRALVERGHRPLIVAFALEQRDRLLDAAWARGTAHLGRVPVTTHAHLAATILSAARPGRARTLRDVDERVVLDRVLSRSELSWGSDLGSIAASEAFRAALLDLCHLLAQNGVSAGDAARAMSKGADARPQDVLAVYGLYRRELERRGLVTFYDAAWRAADAVNGDATLTPLAGVDVLLVDDFQDLDAGQYRLIEALAPPGGDVAVEVFGDPTGPRFSFRGTSDCFLQDEFPRRYRPVDHVLEPWRVDHAALGPVLEGLTAATAAGFAAPAAELPLFAAARVEARPCTGLEASAAVAEDEMAEAQHCAQTAGEWLRSGITPGEIAVVARDAAAVRTAMLLAFREGGVPFDAGDDGLPATDELLHLLFGALGRDASERCTESLAASPLFPALLAAVREVRAPAPPARQPVRDAEWMAERLRATHADSRRGLDVEGVLRAIADPLAAVVGGVAAASVERHIDEWRRYAEVAAHAGGKASLDEFRRHYLGTAPRAAPDAARVRLYSAHEATGRSFRGVVVAGCAEGLFPAAGPREGYLPVAELARAFAATHGPLSRELAARADRDAAERAELALLLTAITRGAERLRVTAPASVGGEAVVPARALAPLFESAAAPLVRLAGPAARAAAALAAAPRTEEAARLAGRFDAVAARWLSPPAPPRLPRPGSFTLSPSGLETFSQCQRKFFYSRLLRIAEPESIHLTIGNVFHEVMSRMVAVGMSREDVRRALADPGVEQVLDEVIARRMPDHGEWVRALSRIHVARMVRAVIDLEDEREGNYRVAGIERAVEFADSGARVRGKIDRLDEVEGLGTVIIDYKASANIRKTAESIRERIEDETQRGLWQVPLYRESLVRDGHDVAAFLYYAVPPGEEAHACGLQTGEGRRPRAIKDRHRKHQDRYGVIATEALAAAVAEAFAVHATIAGGACGFTRTEDRESCKRCFFAHACQRTSGLT